MKSIVTDAAASPLNRQQLEQILSAVGDAITVQDGSGTLLYANDRALRMMGVASRSELPPDGTREIVSRFEIFDERGRPFPVEDLPGRRALHGEAGGEVLLRFRSLDGEDRWARVSAQPIVGPDGSVALAVNTFRDVTAQRQAEAKLQFQAELLDQTEAAIVSADARGVVSYWNDAARLLLGRNGNEAAGIELQDLIVTEANAPERTPPAPLEEVLAGRRWEGEALAIRSDQAVVPVFAVLSPIDDDVRGVVGVSAVMFDLTARRQAESRLRLSEERYRTLADSLPHIVWTAGPDGAITGVNRRFTEYTGVPGEAAAGWAWAEFIHPEDLPGMLQRWSSSIETGREFHTEFRMRRADGAFRWHMSRSLPLRDETGMAVSWIGTSTDIEDRKRAERGLAFLAEASRVLNESLDYEETLAAVARLAVPRIADWCRVDLLDREGRLQLVAVAHVDATKEALAREVNRRWPVRLDASTGIARVMRTARSEHVEEIPPEFVERNVEDPELRSILLELGLQSSMIVPLTADGRAIGTISFIAAESGRHFDRADLALAEDLSRRATAAIENALLYQRVSQFKGAVDNSTDCVFMYDPDTLRFTYVNRGAVEQVGYSADELLRMTPLDLKPEFDERRYRDLIAPLIAGELDSRAFETVQRRKDGVLIPVDVVLQRIPVMPDGLRVIAFVRDVSDRVETQARLRRLAQAERTRAAELDAVIRAMGEAVIVFDADGLVTLSNPAADALFSEAAIARWQDVMELFEEPDDEFPRLGSTSPQGPAEFHLRQQRRWVEVTAYPVLVEPDGGADSPGPSGVGVTILVMRDVTEPREASAMREAFIGVLSHELRTPVTTIFGSSKVLERAEGRLTEEARRDIYSDIAAESERLYRLVEDLLVLARYGDAPLNLGDEPVLLQRILPAAVAAEQARWPGTEFVTEIPTGLPTVRADATYVEQVARNLLGNAAKYGQAGGWVRLALESADDEVIVRVTDNGPGFPDDEADKLFELFYRSPLTAAHATGAGIGLFVCRRLIEAMGGRIWARNAPDGGAEFGFTLRRFTEDE